MKKKGVWRKKNWEEEMKKGQKAEGKIQLGEEEF